MEKNPNSNQSIIDMILQIISEGDIISVSNLTRSATSQTNMITCLFFALVKALTYLGVKMCRKEVGGLRGESVIISQGELTVLVQVFKDPIDEALAKSETLLASEIVQTNRSIAALLGAPTLLECRQITPEEIMHLGINKSFAKLRKTASGKSWIMYFEKWKPTHNETSVENSIVTYGKALYNMASGGMNPHLSVDSVFREICFIRCEEAVKELKKLCVQKQIETECKKLCTKSGEPIEEEEKTLAFQIAKLDIKDAKEEKGESSVAWGKKETEEKKIDIVGSNKINVKEDKNSGIVDGNMKDADVSNSVPEKIDGSL